MLLLVLTTFIVSVVALADGGMWLLEQMNDRANDLYAKGLELPVEDIKRSAGVSA